MNLEQKKAYTDCRKIFKEVYEKYSALGILSSFPNHKSIFYDNYRCSKRNIIFKVKINREFIFGIDFDMLKGVIRNFGSTALFTETNLDRVKAAKDLMKKITDEIDKRTLIYRFIYKNNS